MRRVATNEEIIHRIRHPRHIGRDGLVRPSIAHETFGNYLFDVRLSFPFDSRFPTLFFLEIS